MESLLVAQQYGICIIDEMYRTIGHIYNVIHFVITDKDPGKCTYIVIKKIEQEMTYD